MPLVSIQQGKGRNVKLCYQQFYNVLIYVRCLQFMSHQKTGYLGIPY